MTFVKACQRPLSQEPQLYKLREYTGYFLFKCILWVASYDKSVETCVDILKCST